METPANPQQEAVKAALHVIEAVWSRGAPPTAVQAVLSRFVRWCDAAHVYGLGPLTQAMEAEGIEPFASAVFQNRQRLLTPDGGILKAEAVYRVAHLLHERGAITPEAICRLSGDTVFEAAAHQIPGVGQTTLHRLYALCGGSPTPVPAPRVPDVVHPLVPEFLDAPPAELVVPTTVAPPTKPPKPKARPKKSAAPAEETDAVEAVEGIETPNKEIKTDDTYRVRIREIPTNERPRERLIQYGAEAVSVEELLAILLRTGTEKMNAIDLAHHLLTRHGGMRGLSTLTVEEMSLIHGIGPAKATQIKAAIEFGRRLVAISPEERPKIRSPRDLYNLIGPSLRDEKREHFIAVLLDTKNGIIRQKTVSIGDLSSSLVHPREVFLEAIRHSAASMIVAHNHPSGDPSPSPEDVAVTRRLCEAGTLLGIELLDHIVVGDGKWVSLKEKGLM